MKKMNWMLASGVAAVLVNGCATSASRNLDQKLASEPAVAGRQALSDRADALIEGSQELTGAQKADLMQIKSRLRSDLESLTSQSLRLRSILMKNMLTPDYSAEEVNLIEDRLKTVENNRLSSIFDAVDQANKILGRKSLRAEVMNNFLTERGSGS